MNDNRSYLRHEDTARKVLSLLVDSRLLVPVPTGDPLHPVLLALSSGAVEQAAAVIARAQPRPVRKVYHGEKTISSFG